MTFNLQNSESFTEEEKELQKRFSKVLGSAVNPVLREGNADRRAAVSVKKFAQKFPHRMMKPWPASGSKARVAHMTEKDFFESEKSVTLDSPTEVKIQFEDGSGNKTILKDKLPLLAGEVIDTSVMNVAALRKFYAEQIEEAKKVCNRCIVKEPCLAWALESGQDAGVWGGLSEDERRALKRRAARNRARMQEQNQINNPV